MALRAEYWLENDDSQDTARRDDGHSADLPLVLAEGWRCMFRDVSDGMVVLDERGRVLEHNDAFASLVGSSGAVGRMLIELVRDRVPTLVEALRTAEHELRARVTDAVSGLEVLMIPIEWADGGSIGTIVSLRDISEELAQKAREELHQGDLMRARTFQRLLFAQPPRLPMHDVDVVYRPLEQIGGDFFDVSLLPDGRVRMFIADATGHGVTAALVTMLLKCGYDSIKLTDGGPGDVLSAINEKMASLRRSCGFDVMFTAAVVDVAPDSGILVHSSAGHPAPWVASRGKVEELESGGTFLGRSSGHRYPSWTLQLEPDATVYLVTDGIAEARRSAGELFGESGLREAIANANSLPAGACGAVLAELDRWLGPVAADDDITILALRRRVER